MFDGIRKWFAVRHASKRADEIDLLNKEIGTEMRILIHKQGTLTEPQKDDYLKRLEKLKNELETLKASYQ